MRVPDSLASAFGAPFEELLGTFSLERGLIQEGESLNSKRFLARSVIPHVKKLSDLFNRRDEESAAKGLAPYWRNSSNPENLRLAYFLYFMPPNLFRVASIWAELKRLGFQWKGRGELRALELGAGPASGACGIAAGELFSPLGLPDRGNWALIEQNKSMLELGSKWAASFFTHFASSACQNWGIRDFHRTLDFNSSLLPPSAPTFNLWLMSFVLNETSESTETLAKSLFQTWENHLDEEGLVILVEPALKLQSRRLLELRKHLLEEFKRSKKSDYKILLPCLGHQACGALAAAEDWCHEEVTWWRPPYFRIIDQMAGLDRKTLPFSYLVLTRSSRSREEILPEIAQSKTENRYRLVSPSHKEGPAVEFYLCGQNGKSKVRYHSRDARNERTVDLDRGDILLDAKFTSHSQPPQLQTLTKIG